MRILVSAAALVVFSACLVCPAAAGEQASEPTSTQPRFDLGVVPVIGNREPAAVRLGTETVDAQTLDDLNRYDLSEALNLVPGLAVQNVGQRRERLISVRGFNSRQVPLFIDGVPVYVPYDGNVDLSRFGVDYVSKINVSKGLTSVLYGPNIMGGAINLVSRRPAAPLEMAFDVGSEMGEGSDSMRSRLSARVGGMRGNAYGLISVSHLDAEGYRLPDDFKPVPAEDGGARDNADSRDTVVSAKLGYLAEGGDEVALSYYRQDGDKNSPPYAGTAGQARFWQWPYWDKQSVYLTGRNGVSEQGTLRWRAYFDRFENSLSSFDDATYSSFERPFAFEGSVYDDYTFGGNTDFEWRWSPTQATRTALHWKRDVHREVDEVDAPQERYEDRIWALAFEHEWLIRQGMTLTPGYSHTVQDGRRADNVVDGMIEAQPVGRADADNAQLVLTWSATATGELIAGVSRKTRFPTIKDRFSFRLGSAVPNPDLAPETARHLELAWQQRLGQASLRAALFQADLDDAIENVTIDPALCTAPNPTCFQQRNVGQQRNRGVELSLGWAPDAQWQIDAQASFLDRDNRSSPEIRPTDTPDQVYRLALGWQPLQRWKLRADAQHETERDSATDGSRKTEAFTLVNAFVRYQPMPRVGVELGGRNLTDELYAYQEGFFEAGRTWLAQLDYRY